MNKKIKIIAIVLGIVLVVSLIIGSVVLAQDNDSSSSTSTTTTTVTSRQDAFLSALAAKLNISVDQLKTYIKEAQNETQSQYIKDRLQALVDEGKITQAEADQYLEWWNSKPTFSNNFDFGFNGGCQKGMMGGRGWFGGGFHISKSGLMSTANS